MANCPSSHYVTDFTSHHVGCCTLYHISVYVSYAAATVMMTDVLLMAFPSLNIKP